jgi:hypothetical protein
MTKHKGKGKGKASQGSAEPQYGPAALGIALPDPPWKPTLTALPAASGSAGTISDAQIRGLLNDMKKVPDLPADARTILQRYQKRQGQRTTKTMHQAVTDLGKAREALDQAHLARHQLHGSWRHFLNEALTTWQTYTEGFKQQEADLVARIEEAKQCLHSAKEVFEECRNALTDLNQTDQRLVEDAEAVMTVDAEDEREDPAVTRLQQDLESMRGHLATQAECRSSCRGCRKFCKAASARRSRATCPCSNTWLWCLGAFWWGPQVASASQSPCDGRLVTGVGHAATLA